MNNKFYPSFYIENQMVIMTFPDGIYYKQFLLTFFILLIHFSISESDFLNYHFRFLIERGFHVIL